MNLPLLVLASASKARRELLVSAGLHPTIHPSEFDESSIQITEPGPLVECLARNKAEHVASEYTFYESGALVLGCDSVLWMNGQIHGKPKGVEDAIARWKTMRGKSGEIITGHALIDVGHQKTIVHHRKTMVEFAQVSDRQIEAYIATGDPLQCAGCFTLEGRGSSFIEKIHGCHSNVLGLSMPLLRDMLMKLGYDLTDFWPVVH
ncbi:MAG: nucleoside triphosphate pyrophosphatase [Cyanobacteria bacterium P01_F01_bin.150]